MEIYILGIAHGSMDFLELTVVDPEVPFLLSPGGLPIKKNLQILDLENQTHLLFERAASHDCQTRLTECVYVDVSLSRKNVRPHDCKRRSRIIGDKFDV